MKRNVVVSLPLAEPRSHDSTPFLLRDEVDRLIRSWHAPTMSDTELEAQAQAYCASPARRVMPFAGWLIARGHGEFQRPR